MVVMSLTLDGIYNFDNFSIDFSLPANDETPTSDCGCLQGRPDFHYKKSVILMGANATGKTNLGRVLYNIFEFMSTGNELFLVDMAARDSVGSLSINFVSEDLFLHRFSAEIDRKDSNTQWDHSCTRIAEDDTYEKCAERLAGRSKNGNVSLKDLRKAVNKSKFHIAFPRIIPTLRFADVDKTVLLHTLKAVVGTIDPTLTDVFISNDLRDSFIIRRKDTEIVIQDGKPYDREYLSEGTTDGISIAILLTMVFSNSNSFYYCDNLFSRIHTNIEKNIFRIIAGSLKENEQIIFATNNADMLDLNLPKHSYVFLKKKVTDGKCKTSAVWASDIPKQYSGSLRYAIESNMLSSLPDCSLLDALHQDIAH